jgi:hypothetical protein
MPRPQFSLKTLLWLMAVVAVCVSPIGQLVWLVTFPVKLGRLRPPRSDTYLAEMMPPLRYPLVDDCSVSPRPTH